VTFRTRLGFAATAAATCVAIVLGLGFAGPGASQITTDERVAARRVTVRFFHALDQGRWSQACSMFSSQFYVRHHVVDRKHCIAGLTVGMGGTAVKFRIDRVEAKGNRATVHATVDGAPGTVQLIREKRRFRVLDLHATRS
jgi:hypothetical protein